MVLKTWSAGTPMRPAASTAPSFSTGSSKIAEALALVGGNRELLCDIARVFLDQCPKILEDTRQSLARADYSALGAAAHKLASSVGQLGGQRAFIAAKKLEEVSGEADPPNASKALTELEGEIQLLCSAISGANYFSRSAAKFLH